MKQRLTVFLLTDMEGIAGIDTIEEMDRDSEIFLTSQKKLCESINLCVTSCFDAGADRVYYLDGHAGGGNVIEDHIDPRAVKCSINEWQTLLKNGDIDCQIELGAHARAGTIGGFLDHTLSSRAIYSVRVNGMEMSELSLHALLCAKYHVPIVAVTGDETACAQAREYIPAIFVGAVKNATVRNVATTYPNADNILCNTVKAALADWKSVPCFQISTPLTVEYTYYRTDMCEEALVKYMGDVVRVDARTLKKTVDTLTSYADLKF